jgi:cold shock CspA family protein
LQEALVVEEYGTIISLRISFGFIQNIHSDEQVYFSEQDIYPGVKVGDHVAFTAQQSSKGLAATKIRPIPDAVEVESLATKVLGTIARIPERHRSNCGLIEVELSSISPELQTILRRKPANTISYRPKDLEQLPRNVLLDRGDFVEFTMAKANATNLILATDIRLKQPKREREREKAITQQIQRMLDAGAVREIGIITAVKNKEYGFIKAQDRKDELYFRMDGFLGDEAAAIKDVSVSSLTGRVNTRFTDERLYRERRSSFSWWLKWSVVA